MMASRKVSGFTLIEVLIAAVILFSIITTMTLVYRGALLASEKAEKSILLTRHVSFIRQKVSDDFRQSSAPSLRRNTGKFGPIEYEWLATLTHVGQPSAIVLEDSGRSEDLKYYLWIIELTLRNGSHVRDYEFTEISW